MFRVQFDTDNAAFVDDPDEVRRILRALAAECRRGSGPIRNINGKRVGSWEWTRESEEE